MSQRQLAAKSKIAQKEESIPILELTAALKLVKLQSSILVSLENYQIMTQPYYIGCLPRVCGPFMSEKTIEALSSVDPN